MAPSYYLAPSLAKLRDEVNAHWPNRDKTSDGWIGDTAHSARVSDHNPDWTYGGIVRAIDIDSSGIDAYLVVNAALADARTQYVIHKFPGKKPIIWSRTFGLRIGRVYKGDNPHDHHIHVSIRHTRVAERTVTSWFTRARPILKPKPPKDTDMQLTDKIGRSGLTVGVVLERIANGAVQITRLRGDMKTVKDQLAALDAKLDAALKEK